jgi:membrane protein DedA with SNARE-associated domain
MFATLATSKLAYGLYAPIIVTAGMARAPYWRFLAESLLLSAVVLGAWLLLGVGIGRAYGAMGAQASWLMTAIGLVGLAAFVLVARHARGRVTGSRAGGGRRVTREA